MIGLLQIRPPHPALPVPKMPYACHTLGIRAPYAQNTLKSLNFLDQHHPAHRLDRALDLRRDGVGFGQFNIHFAPALALHA